MTDEELLSRVTGIFDGDAKKMTRMDRRGHLLMALPSDRLAAGMAVRLYQPQRRMARVSVLLVRILLRSGLHGRLMPKIHIPITQHTATVAPPLPVVDHGTCGVLLGSPEHRIRRAVASFRSQGDWQVAKIAFGPAGREVIDGEAAAIASLPERTRGVPELHGVHHGDGVSLLRLPYINGRVLRRDEMKDALDLLDSWRTALDPKPMTGFPEWAAIESAIQGKAGGGKVLERFQAIDLVPSIRHGDFARWNLIRRTDGSIVALDWEWGESTGMPGIDLAHFLLQDALLVDRVKPAEAIRKVLDRLDHSGCREYLRKTGWPAKPLLPIIASLAFKQGSRQQDTAMALDAALGLLQPASVS